MSRNLEFAGIFGGGSIAVLATVLSISAPANALNFTTFTDRASWEAAVGGSFSEETFNSFTVDTSFDSSSVDVGDFTLIGTGSGSGRNFIDADRRNFFTSVSSALDGTVIQGFVNSGFPFN